MIELDPPPYVEHRGHPVTWAPWAAGVESTLRLHFDVSCDLCGDDRTPPGTHGTVLDPVEARPVIELYATSCPGCARVVVVALSDPGWWWTIGGPGALPVGVEHRDPPAGRPRPARRRPAQEATSPVPDRAATPPPAPAATENQRHAAREAFRAAQAAKRATR